MVISSPPTVASTSALFVGSTPDWPLFGLKKRTRLTAINATNPRIRTLLVRSNLLSCLSIYGNLYRVGLKRRILNERGEGCNLSAKHIRQISAARFAPYRADDILVRECIRWRLRHSRGAGSVFSSW